MERTIKGIFDILDIDHVNTELGALFSQKYKIERKCDITITQNEYKNRLFPNDFLDKEKLHRSLAKDFGEDPDKSIGEELDFLLNHCPAINYHQSFVEYIKKFLTPRAEINDDFTYIREFSWDSLLCVGINYQDSGCLSITIRFKEL